MNRKLAAWLFAYGGWLLLIGMAGFLSNPEKAKTALLSGGFFGSLSFFWAVLLRQERRWARDAALISTGLITLAFTWRAWMSWSAVFNGRPEKWVAASLISGLWIASVLILPFLWKAAREPGGLFSRRLS